MTVNLSVSELKPNPDCVDPDIQSHTYRLQLQIQPTSQANVTEITLQGARFAPLSSAPPPRALIVVNHGYGEYLSSTYTSYVIPQLVKRLSAVVFGHDHVGHGRSSGERCQTQVDYTHDYAIPVIEHCRYMQGLYPNLPLFVLGHSMGGLISLLAVLAAPEPSFFKGAVLMAPLIEVDPSMATPCNIFMAKWLTNILPRLQISKVVSEAITRNQMALDEMLADKLNYDGGVKVKFAFYGLHALEYLEKSLGKIKLPLLIQQGAMDTIVRPEGARKLFATVPAEDKRLLEYPEAFHNMYIEFEEVVQKVVDDEIEWLAKRLNI